MLNLKKTRNKLILLVAVGTTLGAMNVIAHAQPSSTPVLTPSAKPIVMKLAYPDTKENAAYTTFVQPFVEAVEKRTGGRVKFDVYPMESLLKANQMLAGVSRGFAEAAMLTANNPAEFPLQSIVDSPMVLTSAVAASRAYFGMIDEVPEVAEEYSRNNVVPIIVALGGFQQLWSSKKPVNRMEDFKGMIIRTNAPMSNPVKLWGGTPTWVSTGEIYLALQKGIIDGAITGHFTAYARSLYEVGKYMTIGNFEYGVGNGLVFNRDTLNGLPKEIQNIIRDTGREIQMIGAKRFEQIEKDLVNKFKDKGAIVSYLSAQERARLRATIQPLFDSFVTKYGTAAEKVLRLIDRIENETGK